MYRRTRGHYTVSAARWTSCSARCSYLNLGSCPSSVLHGSLTNHATSFREDPDFLSRNLLAPKQSNQLLSFAHVAGLHELKILSPQVMKDSIDLLPKITCLDHRSLYVKLLKRLLTELTISTSHHSQNHRIVSLASSIWCSDQEWHRGSYAQWSCGPCWL